MTGVLWWHLPDSESYVGSVARFSDVTAKALVLYTAIFYIEMGIGKTGLLGYWPPVKSGQVGCVALPLAHSSAKCAWCRVFWRFLV